MSDLGPVLVCAIIFITVYKVFELFVRRSERIAMIEKLSSGLEPQILKTRLNLPSYQTDNYSSWAIRIGLLLVGIGLGIVVAAVIDLLAVPPAISEGQLFHEFRHTISVLYPAFATLFGGLGLVIAYFIEKKSWKKNSEEEEI